jgi:hypothetical protein
MEAINNTRKLVPSVELLDRLKEIFEVKKGLDLAKIFDVKPNTVSSWKIRNAIPYYRIMEVCCKYNICLNDLFYDNYLPISSIEKEYCQIPILYLENHFDYYFNQKSKVLERAYFPKNIGFDFIIQLAVDSGKEVNNEIIYTYCKKSSITNLILDEEYVLLLKGKGFQCYKLVDKDYMKEKLYVNSKSKERVSINMKDVIEVFHCKGKYKNLLTNTF